MKDTGVITRRATFIAAMLLAVQAGMLAWMAYRDSACWDEVGHFDAGVSFWKTGENWLYRVNPPLVRQIACAPVVLLQPDLKPDPNASDRDPALRGEFMGGREMAEALDRRFFRLLTVARWTCIPFALLGGWIAFTWARAMFGNAAAILTIILWTISPSILAYGHLIVPDAAATSLGLCSAYAFWRWLRSPSWHEAIGAGITLGFAELTKMTWVVLFPLLPILWVTYRLVDVTERNPAMWRRQALQVCMVLLLGLVVLNAGYGFSGMLKPVGQYQFMSPTLAGRQTTTSTGENSPGNRFARSWSAHVPIPLPACYVSGVDQQMRDFDGKMWSYLNGQWRLGGWWYYYLFALMIKAPIGTLLLILLSIAVGAAGVTSRPAIANEVFLFAFPISVIALVSSQTGFNHHLRYVLPALPYLYISAGRLALYIGSETKVLGTLVVALACGAAGSSLHVYPHSLSYFNELVGGPLRGHYYLSNSNTDWGQDLFYLKDWIDSHPESQPIYLAYDLPLIDSHSVGLQYRTIPVPKRPLERLRLRPGWYALSVNLMHDPNRGLGDFLRAKPAGMAGYSIYIYHVTSSDLGRPN